MNRSKTFCIWTCGPFVACILVGGIFTNCSQHSISRPGLTLSPAEKQQWETFRQREYVAGIAAMDHSGPAISLWVTGGMMQARGLVLRRGMSGWASWYLPSSEERNAYAISLTREDLVWDDVVDDIRDLPDRPTAEDKQVLYQDGQTVTIDYIDHNRDERLFLQVHEPCGREGALANSMCGLVKKMELKACRTLMIMEWSNQTGHKTLL